MIPAVFVLVLRLADVPHAIADPLADQVEGESAGASAYERTTDGKLVREIMERKRTTIERGIKLVVVLLCGRELVEDPSLDSRLGLIRRQSGLDSRSSLFVVSPTNQAEINFFVSNLKKELYPSALDYYREHGRRARRKKARQVSKGKLSDKGWIVRTEFKLATFAELRGETEMALKCVLVSVSFWAPRERLIHSVLLKNRHYEDCYDVLIDMFAASPPLLAIKGKRWAEAKVLADCLNVKVRFPLPCLSPQATLLTISPTTDC